MLLHPEKTQKSPFREMKKKSESRTGTKNYTEGTLRTRKPFSTEITKISKSKFFEEKSQSAEIIQMVSEWFESMQCVHNENSGRLLGS